MNNSTPNFNGSQENQIKKIITSIEQLWNEINLLKKDVVKINMSLDNRFSQPFWIINKYWRFKLGDTNKKLILQQSSDLVEWINASIFDVTD